MKKSILALLLAVLMVASLLPAAALADGTDEGGFNFVAAIASANVNLGNADRANKASELIKKSRLFITILLCLRLFTRRV